MAHQIAISDQAIAHCSDAGDGCLEVLPNLGYLRCLIANVVFVGQRGAGDGNWVLVDAGVIGTESAIRDTAKRRFGQNGRPAAIVLTHGHFDHVGVLESLAATWDVPIYAHQLEAPFLNGSAAYPPPDPSVGGGLMSALSRFYPTKPVDVTRWLKPLPSDGSLPYLPDWRWLHTPGHSPGHVSFWRENDKSLIVGDAFVTTRAESAYATATQEPELHGPPAYFTINWDEAKQSLQALAALKPHLVVSGHGRALSGSHMQVCLDELARDFDRIARPSQGRYIDHPV